MGKNWKVIFHWSGIIRSIVSNVRQRGSGELTGTSKVYLDSCNSKFESIKCCSSLSTSVIKRS